jgi:hypothetical protein
MNLQRMKDHASQLRKFADEMTARASIAPNDFMLQLVARNQQAAAEEIEMEYLVAFGKQNSQSLEWRLVSERTRRGQVPMSLLAKLADALNKLLLKAAFFARNKEDASRGVGDMFANEMNLRLAGISEGSARLFIVGNTEPDSTGSAPLIEGYRHVLNALGAGDRPSDFYEHLGDLGEQASRALHDALKALEQEECSVEVTWHSGTEGSSQALRFDQIVRMRTMLSDSVDNDPEDDEVSGSIGLLALNGRIQILGVSGEKTNIRFRPKSQGAWVSRLRLGETVSLKTKARIYRDPSTGYETRVHRLSDVGNN